MADETIRASLGLDATSFTRGLDKANAQGAKFKKRLEGIVGPGLLRGSGIGLIAGALAGGFLSASRRAVEMAEALERSGKAVGENLRAAGELSRTWESIKASAQGTAVAALGGLARIGENIGRRIAVGIYGEDQVSEGERSEAAAIVRERALAVAKTVTATREGDKAAATRKTVDLQAQLARIEAQLKALAFARLSLVQQEAALQERGVALVREYSLAEAGSVERAEIRLEASRAFDQLQQVQMQRQEEMTTQAEREAAAREAAANSLAAQAANAARVLDLTARASSIQAAAAQEMARVGQAAEGVARSINDIISLGQGPDASGEKNGMLVIPSHVGDMSRSQFNQAQRIAQQDQRARRAQMRGNNDLAARIRGENATRAERAFPTVREGNQSERARIKDSAESQVAELRSAVNELKMINDKLAEG